MGKRLFILAEWLLTQKSTAKAVSAGAVLFLVPAYFLAAFMRVSAPFFMSVS